MYSAMYVHIYVEQIMLNMNDNVFIIRFQTKLKFDSELESTGLLTPINNSVKWVLNVTIQGSLLMELESQIDS